MLMPCVFEYSHVCHKYYTVVPQILYSCATNTIHFATNTIRFATNIDYGKLRHFCDDPVCPDPVWKLSRDPTGHAHPESELLFEVC